MPLSMNSLAAFLSLFVTPLFCSYFLKMYLLLCTSAAEPDCKKPDAKTRMPNPQLELQSCWYGQPQRWGTLAALRGWAQPGGEGQPGPWAEECRGHADAHHCMLGTRPARVKATTVREGGDSCVKCAGFVCVCMPVWPRPPAQVRCDSYKMLPMGGSSVSHPRERVLNAARDGAPGLPTPLQQQVPCTVTTRSQICFGPTSPGCFPHSWGISQGKEAA